MLNKRLRQTSVKWFSKAVISFSASETFNLSSKGVSSILERLKNNQIRWFEKTFTRLFYSHVDTAICAGYTKRTIHLLNSSKCFTTYHMYIFHFNALTEKWGTLYIDAMNFTIAQTANYQISRGRNSKDINVSIKRQDKTFGHQFILQEEYALINGHDHFLILYRCLDMGQFKDLYVEMKQKHLDCKAWKRFASLLDHTSSSLLIRNIPLEEKAFEIVSSSKGDCSKLFHIFPF